MEWIDLPGKYNMPDLELSTNIEHHHSECLDFAYLDAFLTLMGKPTSLQV